MNINTQTKYDKTEPGVRARDACANTAARWLIILALAATSAMVFVPAAIATQIHGFHGVFGSPGVGSGQLSLVSTRGGGFEGVAPGSGVAVNDSTHDVYVVDTGNHRIDEFTSEGDFLRAWGWGVADGITEQLQSCTLTCFRGIEGSHPGELEQPTFIAVDNASGGDGDVYIGDIGDNLVTKYTATGELISSWGSGGQLNGGEAAIGPFGALAGIAVDTNGLLWVYTGFTEHATNEHMFQFDRSGHIAQVPTWEGRGHQPVGIAVDSSEHLFSVDGDGAAVENTSSGTLLGDLNAPTFHGGERITGLAVNSATSDVYLDEEGRTIGAISHECVPVPDGSVHFCESLESFGSGHLSESASVAVDSTTGAVYASSPGAGDVASFDVSIETTIGAASGVTPTSAIVNGFVNPEGSELSACRFEYEPGVSAVCEESPGEIGSGDTSVAVHATIANLQGGSSYHVRLRATNAKASVRSEPGGFTTATLPVIAGERLQDLTATTATIQAEVDPGGSVTTCEIEYGFTTAYTASAPCEPETVEGGTPVGISAQLLGLTPEATYHWRVTAADAGGTATSRDHTFVALAASPRQTDCPNQAFRTGAGARLPGCRAYEMVTPTAKNGSLVGNVFFGDPRPILSNDGSRLIASSIQCFASSESCTGARQSEGEPFEFQRTAGGWETNPLAPSASFSGTTELMFNPNTGLALYSTAAGGQLNNSFYIRRQDGQLESIGPIGDGVTGSESGGRKAASEDLTHLAYETPGPRWSFDATHATSPSLYEYSGQGNSQPRLVGVEGPVGSTALISQCGTELGVNGRSFEPMSATGNVIFFTSIQCPAAANGGTELPADTLFERIDGGHTVKVSVGQPANCHEECEQAAPRDALFEGATADGSRAFFASTEQLTDDSVEDSHSGDSASEGCAHVPVGSSGCNLYESECPAPCSDPAARQLIDLSAGEPARRVPPRVQGAMAISGDGRYVYFVARGVLTEETGVNGREAVEGGENLYLYERTPRVPEGRLRFVVTLPESDAEEWKGGVGIANVTPEGVLVFLSHAGLTSDAVPGEQGAQVYRYDPATTELIRVSIGEKGFDDNGNGGRGDAAIAEPAYAFGLAGAPRTDRTMSDDARYVSFESPVGLTPEAASDVVIGRQGNGTTSYAENVYEWRAAGVDGCAESSGCVSLISSGEDLARSSGAALFSSGSAVALVGTSESGQDTVFTTASQLTAADTDTGIDYYDARIDGGFAPPAVGAECSGNAECRGSVPGAPPEVPAGSGSFAGPGNSASTVTIPGPTNGAPKPSRAQKLAAALKKCRRTGSHSRKRRVACEHQARARYAPAKKTAAKRSSNALKKAGKS